MTGGPILPLVTDDERLARFIVASKWFRQDGTVKQDAFIPPKDLRLSVTRRLDLGDKVWTIAKDFAESQEKTLYGLADLSVSTVKEAKLTLVPDPVLGNPRHAEITGWPEEKPQQKAYAQLLAAGAKFHPAP